MPSSASTRLRLNLQASGENNNVWGDRLNAQVFQLIDDAIAGRTAFALSGTKTLTSTNFVTNEARSAFLDITAGTGGTVTIPGNEKLYLVRNGTSGDVTFTTGGATNATVKAGNVQFVVSDGTNVYLAKERDLGSDLLTTSATPTADGHLTRKAYVDGLNTTEHDARIAGDAATLATAEAYTDATSFAAGSLPGGGSAGQLLRRIAGPSADWHTLNNGDLNTLLPTQAAASGKVLTSNGTDTSWSLAIPAQSGNSGKFLTTDGSAASWSSVTWQEIASNSPTSAASIAFTGLSAWNDLLLVFEAAALSGTVTLLIAVGDATPTYTSNVTLGTLLSGSLSGSILISNARANYGSILTIIGGPGASPSAAVESANAGVAWHMTGGVKAVKITVTSGGGDVFNGGTLRIFGR